LSSIFKIPVLQTIWESQHPRPQHRARIRRTVSSQESPNHKPEKGPQNEFFWQVGAGLSQRHYVIPRVKPGDRISLLQELVVINQNFRNCSCHHAKTAGPRWPAAPAPAVNFPLSYLSNSGTYRKVHGAIAREIPRMERKLLFDILESRAQENPRNATSDFKASADITNTKKVRRLAAVCSTFQCFLPD
jgi:hypothetical protein